MNNKYNSGPGGWYKEPVNKEEPTRECPKCKEQMPISKQYCKCGYNIGYFYKFGVDHQEKKARLFFT